MPSEDTVEFLDFLRDIATLIGAIGFICGAILLVLNYANEYWECATYPLSNQVKMEAGTCLIHEGHGWYSLDSYLTMRNVKLATKDN